MSKIMLCVILSGVALVTEVQAPRWYTAYDFVSDMVAQCVEDAECGTDTECVEAEDRCVRQVTGGTR